MKRKHYAAQNGIAKIRISEGDNCSEVRISLLESFIGKIHKNGKEVKILTNDPVSIEALINALQQALDQRAMDEGRWKRRTR